jgi:acyl carrier protein
MNSKIKLLPIINSVLEGKGLKTVDSLNDDDKLREDLGLDSFDLAELTVIIEEEFNVDIFEDGLVENILEIIKKIDAV